MDEEDLLHFLEDDFLSRVVREERRARDTLLNTRREFLDDRVQRALAMLRHARLLGEREALDLLSELRLGVAVGLLTGVPLETASQLMQRVRSGHLTRATGCTEEEPLRIQRADLVRRELGGGTPNPNQRKPLDASGSAKAESASASARSFLVMPPASCVVSPIRTVHHRMSRSGW